MLAADDDLSEPVTLAPARVLLAPVALAVTDMGAVVAWMEPGDPAAMPGMPGHARLVVQQVALDGTASAAPFEIAVTAPVDTLAITAIAAPRAALVSWAGVRVGSDAGPQVTYLARLDCVP
jgi:hypothetical protein